MIIITKFGGTSVADAEQFKKVKNIIEADDKRKVVVVSAPGKRDKNDNKITDLLYLLSAHLKYGVDYTQIFELIKNRYNEIKEELILKTDIDGEFEKFKAELKAGVSEDYLVSRGEYFNAKLMAEYLGFGFADATNIIHFNYDGKINYEKTSTCAQEAFAKSKNLVVPGFYGAYPSGVIKLFSRGGSDITGSIMANALSAEKYENWTDVSGLLMADPKVVGNPKRIEQITYDELRELSYMGAAVLHEETIFPIRDLNIPIYILNTNHPEEGGTLISETAEDSKQVITGIAGKKNFTSFTVVKSRRSDKLSVIKDVLTVFEKYNLTIEHIPTSIDSFSIVVDSRSVEKCVYDLVSEIKEMPDVNDVSIDSDNALVAVVGRNMVLKPGISGKIFAILGNNNINIKMIAQGAKELNIIFGVSNADFEKAIRAVYENMVI